MFEENKVNKIIETNVICFSKDERIKDNKLNREGKEVGSKIFRSIVDIIRPKVMIVHGSDPCKTVADFLKIPEPIMPDNEDKSVKFFHALGTSLGKNYQPALFFIPSLGGPGWNRWKPWANEHLGEVCKGVKEFLGTGAN